MDEEKVIKIFCRNCSKGTPSVVCIHCGHDNESDHIHNYAIDDKCVICGESCI